MSAIWLKYLPGFLRARFAGRQGLQDAVGNTGWLMLDKLARLVLGLVIAIWMARVLGPAEFGQYNFALAFVALFTSFASFGLDKVVVRELVSNGGMHNRILGSALLLRLLGASFAVFLCIALIHLLVPENAETRLLVAIMSVALLFQAVDVIDFWFQSQVASKYVVIARMPAMLTFFLLRIYLILGAFSLSYYAWTYMLEFLFAGIGLIVVYLMRGNSIVAWRPVAGIAIALLRECWPLVFAGLSVMLYMKIDVIMLSRMSGDAAAGIYSAATRLSEGFYFIPMIIASSIMPILVRARNAGSRPYLDGLFRLYLVMVRVSLAIAVPLVLVAPVLVDVLFGSGFAESAGVLRIHVWASVAVFLGVASSQFLVLEGLQKISLYRTLAGLIVNIVLNLMLIPVYGASGAAIATLVSYFVATFSIMISGKGVQQGVLMLQALNPLTVLGLKGSSAI